MFSGTPGTFDACISCLAICMLAYFLIAVTIHCTGDPAVVEVCTSSFCFLPAAL
jgi:hypothetical protein